MLDFCDFSGMVISAVDQRIKRANSDRVKDQIEALASSSSGSDLTLDSSAAGSHSAAEPSKELKAVGPYKLIRRLGEGGMGQVWLAEQTAPVQRQVAVKLIRVGIYDDEVLQRFRSERQSLAIMDHPAIAKVFDAGATSDGQPYFVMEYVPGILITTYCDEKHLTIKERLKLFITVCEGVQHAHQKAIIHRDLKPANILVAEIDGRPVPRIIDFGLAKAIGPEIDERTLVTITGGFVGTPGYMSPEQASGSGDVDTRTDVYSLGVVLYALLAGDEPFDRTRWKTQTLHETLRQLQEYDPPRPSVKVRSDHASLAARADLRNVPPRQLELLLHGDLDWVTMKALEKERNRRYGTPMELAADLGRYLNNEPILARPASTAYRVRKYVRRHRFGVAVASAVVLLLVAVAIMQAVQVRRIRAERDRTARERDRAKRITDFMQQIFNVSDPSEARGNKITARELLDTASRQIDTGLASDPDAQAQMLKVMGDVYRNLGLFKEAEPLLTRAVELQQRLHGPSDPDTMAAMSSFTLLMHREGRDAEAEKLQREILDTERRVLGPNDPRTVAAIYQLSQILSERGQYADGEKLQREVLALEQQIHGPESPQAIKVEGNLAFTLKLEGHYKEAEKWARQALDGAQRVLGSNHPDTLKIAGILAEILGDQGRYKEQEKLLGSTIAAERRVLGPEHPETLGSMSDLSTCLRNQGRGGEAEKLARYVVEEMSRVLGPDSRVLLASEDNLASVLLMENRFAEAETLYRQLVDSARHALGAEHPETLEAMQGLGNTLMEAGKYPDAEKIYREVLGLQQRVLGPDHPDTAITRYDLGCVTAHEGRKAEAIAFLTEAVDHGLSPPGDLAMDKDPDLNSLHGDPRFAGVIEHAKEMAAKHKNPAAQATATSQKAN